MPRKLLPALDDVLLVSGAATFAVGTGVAVGAFVGWRAGLGVTLALGGLLALAAGVMVAKGRA